MADWSDFVPIGDGSTTLAAQNAQPDADALRKFFSPQSFQRPADYGQTYDDYAKTGKLNVSDQDIDRAIPVALGAGPGSIRAYHGSPYNFNAFDLNKVGTGEGAQAFGHGLYFAQREPVAQSYMEQLQHKAPSQYDRNSPEYAAQWLLKSYMGDADAARLAAMSQRGRRADIGSQDYWQRVADLTGSVEPKRGTMYEVAIDANPSHLLDWDKPYNKQSSLVQQGVAPQLEEGIARSKQTATDLLRRGTDAYGNPLSGPRMSELVKLKDRNPADVIHGMHGDEIYERMGLPAITREQGYVTAADRMREAGIPGVKYFDQASRAAGKGSHNYAINDDNLIHILRKY